MGKARQKPLRKAFGQRLRALREAAEMSQMVLAARADLDPSYVGGIERGERNPSIDAVAQLARALEVEPCELMAFGGPVQASPAELAELVILLQKERPSETRKVLAVAKIMLGHSAP